MLKWCKYWTLYNRLKTWYFHHTYVRFTVVLSYNVMYIINVIYILKNKFYVNVSLVMYYIIIWIHYSKNYLTFNLNRLTHTYNFVAMVIDIKSANTFVLNIYKSMLTHVRFLADVFEVWCHFPVVHACKILILYCKCLY